MNPAGDLKYQPLCTLGNFENKFPGKNLYYKAYIILQESYLEKKLRDVNAI